MTEDFLHFLWKYKYFNKPLKTFDGKGIEVIHQGVYNTDSGPDFFNAKLKIGNMLWAGNVEIHIQSSDWEKHQHQRDKAYDNVILHVVFENDKTIFRKNGEVLSTLELKNYFDFKLLDKYEELNKSKGWIPCEKQISSVDNFTLNTWLDRLLIERLERKSAEILQRLERNKNNWEETFYQTLARGFGFKTNAEPFELLARSVSNITLSKHKNSLFQLEALFFGQAGMLDKLSDEYSLSLKKEYNFLQKKYGLKSIEKHLWKFLRLRPVNFPTIRIAQFASLIFKSKHLFSKIIETNNVKELKKKFSLETSEYWQTHYKFGKRSQKKNKSIGDSSIDILLINSVAPLLFVYGKYKSEEEYCERALKLLESIKPETNSIIKKWNSLKIKSSCAYQTQALLQLKNEYCSNKKCLNCAIGNKLIKNS